MKFKIEKVITPTRVSINGEVVDYREEYYIYTRFWCGLIKMYLHIKNPADWKNAKEVYFEFVPRKTPMYKEAYFEAIPRKTSMYFDRTEAEELIAEIEKNPRKFVRLV